MTDRLLTQEELEALMFDTGIGRMKASLEKAEEKGRAITNPYGQALLQEFVEPLAASLSNMLKVDRTAPGRHKAAVPILEKLDSYVVVYLALRATLNRLVAQPDSPVSALALEIARSIYGELVVSHLADADPDLYRTLTTSLTERLSKDDRHRLTVYRMQAVKNGIEVPEWSMNLYAQVGQYVLTTLVVAGVIEVEFVTEKNSNGSTTAARHYNTVSLHPDVQAKIAAIRQHALLASPYYLPCVEPPRDWTDNFNGGWHTKKLSFRNHGVLTKAHRSSMALYRGHQMPVVLNAVNRMQRSAWKINQPILDVLIALSKDGYNGGEVVSATLPPKPPRPEGLGEEITEEQKPAFLAWKHEVRNWHTKRKQDGARYARFRACITTAERFRHYPAIYFRYMADSRGRLYPMSTGISPQGSDIQKAVLHAATGKPLNTPDAIRWFHIHGANKWGFDKAPLEERHKWVVDRQDQIIAMAEDPLGNREWLKADSPMQFLAWAMEYRDWVNDRSGTFVNRIPVSMDGSCNGLQHLSAMMRDRIGGTATNLIPSEKMHDIYQMVANKMIQLMVAAGPEEDATKESYRLRWINAGATRALVKRTVMTTPYGVTLSSAKFYVREWVRDNKPDYFMQSEYDAAAYYIMPFLWSAIDEVIVKGRLVMKWLQKASRLIVKKMEESGELSTDEPVIRWVTPSGFLATQAHFKYKELRIKTRLTRPVQIVARSFEEDSPDSSSHAAAMAPNFIHSLDASHLHMTIDSLPVHIDFIACIHDDYGTLAADSQDLYVAIRQQFVKLYTEFDPLENLRKRYPFLPPPPEFGDLDIREVLNSPYFFS